MIHHHMIDLRTEDLARRRPAPFPKACLEGRFACPSSFETVARADADNLLRMRLRDARRKPRPEEPAPFRRRRRLEGPDKFWPHCAAKVAP